MAINKVVYGADTLVDLTEDTVTAEDVLNSKSFHTPDGVKRTGTASYPVTDVQVNDESVLDGTVAKVIQPTAEVKTATDQFSTANGGLLSKCMINLVPVQSGSGDPYPAGGGKNKLPLTLDIIKASSPYATWTNNVAVYRGVTCTVQIDDGGNVVGISSNGTASGGNSGLTICKKGTVDYSLFAGKTFILNGGYNNDYYVQFWTSNGAIGVSKGSDSSSFTVPSEEPSDWNITLLVIDTKQVSNYVSKPMIRLSSVTDPTFAPYSNVRPISGHTEVDLYNVGKNRLPITVNSIKTSNGGTWTNNSRTISGITVSILTDIYNNVIGVKLNGTSTAQVLVDYCGTIVNDFVGMKFNGYSGNTTNSEYVQMITYYNAGGGWANETYQANNTDRNISNYAKIKFGFLIRSGQTLNNVIVYPMVRTASETDPTFEPYLGHLYTINLGGTYYGGYLDVVSGEFVATHASETITSMEYYGTYGVDNAPLFYKDLTNTYVQYGSATAPIANKPISNAYRAISVNDATQLKNNEFRTQQVDTPNRYYFRDDRYNSKAQMDAWLSDNPVQVCGKLATPLTIRLTPQMIETLAGQNNLSCPLEGQSLETNGTEYKELFTFADVKEYVKPLIPYSNAGAHNAIYRGKYLGSAVTVDQWTAIQNGTFDDLFIGDYWTIDSVNWRIAHFDYWLGTGNPECTDHHVVIVPDTNLYSAKMNSTDITTGGYYGSEMRGGANYLVSGSSNLYTAKTKVDSAFGSAHILTHREMLTNAVSSGNASGSAWYDSSVDLMSEVMVYGTLAWSNGGKGHEVGNGKGQLALFRHDISKATNRANWWLRSVVSAEAFAFVHHSGAVAYSSASGSLGVRPAFAIK